MKADNESRQEVKSLRQCGQRVVVQVESLAKSVEALRETTNARIDALEKVADERAANTARQFDEVNRQLTEIRSDLAESRRQHQSMYRLLLTGLGSSFIFIVGLLAFLLFGYPG